jgi:hypothetical protein
MLGMVETESITLLLRVGLNPAPFSNRVYGTTGGG